MSLLYNPTEDLRISELSFIKKYGLEVSECEKVGYFPLSIIPDAYNPIFYNLKDIGNEYSERLQQWRVKYELLPKPISQIQQTLKEQLSKHRYRKETDGLLTNGGIVRTDRESQSSLASAKTLSDLIPDNTIDWKAADGWTSIDRSTIMELSKLVGLHVQTCFSLERQFSELIDASESIEDLLIIYQDMYENWPVTANINKHKSVFDMM